MAQARRQKTHVFVSATLMVFVEPLADRESSEDTPSSPGHTGHLHGDASVQCPEEKFSSRGVVVPSSDGDDG